MNNEEFYLQKVKEAYIALKGYPKAKLIQIYKSFNNWGWPAALGDPPVENWAELPRYRRPDMPEDTITKVTFLKPIADAIHLLGVGPKDI